MRAQALESAKSDLDAAVASEVEKTSTLQHELAQSQAAHEARVGEIEAATAAKSEAAAKSQAQSAALQHSLEEVGGGLDHEHL